VVPNYLVPAGSRLASRFHYLIYHSDWEAGHLIYPFSTKQDSAKGPQFDTSQSFLASQVPNSLLICVNSLHADVIYVFPNS
jgi:hypothetical protein